MGAKLNKTKIPQILKLKNQGKTRTEIADILGVSNKNLRNYCNRYNITMPTLYSTRSENRTNLILDYTQKGYSREEIAAKTGIGMNNLQDWAKRNQVPLPMKCAAVDNRNTGNIVIKASIPRTLAEDIINEAKTRKVGIKTLTADLLACIAEGKLYDAVLDR
jgi:transposase